MEGKINIAIFDGSGDGREAYIATAQEIGRIFEIAEHIPDEWTKMDVSKLAENIAENIKAGGGENERVHAEGNN